MNDDGLDGLYDAHLRTVMRRADLALAATGFDALAIYAGEPPMQFLDDQAYPFKVNPHFKAWVPVTDTPGCVLVYAPGSPPRLLFPRSDDYWHRPAPLPRDGWAERIEVIPLAPTDTAARLWRDLGRTAIIAPPDVAATGELNPAALLTRLHFDRAVKTEYEVECMRRASRLAVCGHTVAAEAFREGVSEYAAAERYLAACGQREEEMPYNNIVAYNEHAATLHYQHLDRTPPPTRRSLLIDAGAAFRGYAADITRSHAAGPGSYADLIDALDRAQRSLCAEIVAGRDYRDVHLLAHRLVGDVLHEAGIIRLAGAAALELGITGVFFPHGIGHLLGLQVHDAGGLLADGGGREHARPEGHPFLRLTRSLAPGMVVTVEPGIYFIDSLLKAAGADSRASYIDWERVATLRPYGGIRIEDDVVTTTSAPENLTRDAFAHREGRVAPASGGATEPGQR